MNAQERLAPVMAKLEERMIPSSEKALPKKIQSWVEYFSQNDEKARQVHNHAVRLLTKYKAGGSLKPDEVYEDAIQLKNFENTGDLDFPPFNKNIYTTKTGLDIGGVNRKFTEAIVTEYAQEVLVASLFSLNRGVLGDRLSKTMELDQIDAVMRSIKKGDHIQLATGQGKSSTVIPIASIVESLTSDKRSSVVVSINSNLVSDLENETKSLIGRAGKKGMALPLFTENRTKHEEQVGEATKKKMMKEAVAGNGDSYPPEIEKEIFTTYWGEDIYGARTNFIDKVKDMVAGPKITFMSKDDFVFNVSQGGEAFVKMCPKVFFDEIDAPYIIGETYQSTHEDLYMSPDNFVDMASRYVFDKIVLSQIDPEEDFEVYKGSGTLSEEGEDRLTKIDWGGFFKNRYSNKSMSGAFEEATERIGEHLKLDSSQLSALRNRVWESLNSTLVHKRTRHKESNSLHTAVIGSATNLANGYYSLNKLFIAEGENITVRSEYFDQLMENHKFDPDTHISMLALTDRFSIVNLLPKASDSIKFPTILTMLGDKVVGYSGTLVQRDLLTGEPVTSPLASFLKAATGKNIFEVNPPETKKPPTPKIADDFDGMKQIVSETINQIQDGKPLLLVCHYDTKITKEIFDQLAIIYPDQEIAIVPSIPSKPEKLKEYYDELKRLTKALADGKIKILVSSGSLGIGANIVKSDGSFPDLRVGIVGLPENESQLRQNLGRRRMKGNEFFWITDKQSLRERATWLNEQTGSLMKAFLTQSKAESEIDALPTNSEGDLKFVLKLIHDAHVGTIANEEFTVAYDLFFRKEVMSAANYFLQDRIKREYFDKGTDWEKDGEALGRLNRLERLFGLPDSLYERLLMPDVTLGIQSSDIRDYMSKLKIRVTANDLIKKTIDTWFHQIKEQAEYVDRNIYREGKQKVQEFYFLQPPKGYEFHSKSSSTYNPAAGEPTTVELGMVSSVNVAVPGVRFESGTTYLIGNMDMGKLSQIDSLYLYSKGGKNVMFTPLIR